MFKVLIPVGSSAASQQAVKHVIQRSWAREALEPHLLHVLRSRHSHDMAALDAAGDLFQRAGVPCIAHIRYGDPAREIVRFAESNRFGGIVMASSGLGSLAEMLAGSVTAQVLRTSRIPVEVVPVSPRARARAYATTAGIGAGLGVLVYAALT